MRFVGAVLLSLLLLSNARAQLSFTTVDPGITPILEAWRDESPSYWKTHSLTAFDQNGDGKLDLYVNTHLGHGGTILRQGETLTAWSDVTVSLGQSRSAMPREARPLFVDMDLDGMVDILAVGDENSIKNIRNLGTSLVPTNGHLHPMSRCQTLDIDANGYPDAIRYDERNFGKLTVQQAINNYPASDVFTYSSTQISVPADIPTAVADTLVALESDTNTANRYSSPLYWRGDLNADGREDCIVQYAGNYGGTAYRFGRYLFRDANGDLIDKTATAGIPAGLVPLLPPSDVDGDGKMDIVCGYGSRSICGMYKQQAGDTFTMSQVDGLPASTSLDVAACVYHTSASYLYELRWHDFDADGDDDLFVSRMRLGAFRVYENDAGSLREVVRGVHADSAGWDICDINGDGRLDVVVCGSSTQSDVTTTFYINTSSGGEPPPPPGPPGEQIIKVNGVTQAGATIKRNGVVIPPPTAPESADDVFEIETP